MEGNPAVPVVIIKPKLRVDIEEELDRQALKRKLKRAVRGPKEAKRQARVAEKAKSFWDV